MISDARAAGLCCALYEPSPVNPFAVIDDGADDGICWALAREGDCDVIVLRGSVTLRDWLRDVLALTLPYTSRRMGPVHPGFYLGLDNCWSDIAKVLRPDAPVVVTGHSLGAGRAAILTALMIDAGRAPAARIVFGEPKPGFAQLATYISTVPGRSYRNGDDRHHDLVTEMPFSFPPEDYEHASPLIKVCAPPPPDHSWGIFAYHHIELYLAAVSAIENPK